MPAAARRLNDPKVRLPRGTLVSGLRRRSLAASGSAVRPMGVHGAPAHAADDQPGLSRMHGNRARPVLRARRRSQATNRVGVTADVPWTAKARTGAGQGEGVATEDWFVMRISPG